MKAPGAPTHSFSFTAAISRCAWGSLAPGIFSFGSLPKPCRRGRGPPQRLDRNGQSRDTPRAKTKTVIPLLTRRRPCVRCCPLYQASSMRSMWSGGRCTEGTKGCARDREASGVPRGIQRHSTCLWRAVSGPRADREQEEEPLHSLNCPKQV